MQKSYYKYKHSRNYCKELKNKIVRLSAYCRIWSNLFDMRNFWVLQHEKVFVFILNINLSPKIFKSLLRPPYNRLYSTRFHCIFDKTSIISSVTRSFNLYIFIIIIIIDNNSYLQHYTRVYIYIEAVVPEEVECHLSCARNANGCSRTAVE